MPVAPDNSLDQMKDMRDELRGEDMEHDTENPDHSRKAYIEEWVKKVKKDKDKWRKDFERMKKNMAFVSSIQWKNQKEISEDRYVANFTNRLVAQKTATLYSRNPKAEWQRRKRMDFAIWDEKQESLVQSLMEIQNALQMGFELPPNAVAIVQDFEKGLQRRRDIEKVGRTLETVYQYQVDTQEPEFKTQMKSLVWRTAVCGVGYIRICYVSDYDNTDLTVSTTRVDVDDRAKTLEGLHEKQEDGKIEAEHKDVERMSLLSESVLDSFRNQEKNPIRQKIVYDFPPSTSIIPDSHCRSLKDFIGAKHLTQEYFLPVKFVNDYYNVDIKTDSVAKYDREGEPAKVINQTTSVHEPKSDPHVWVLDIQDLETNTRFVIAEGHPDYLVAPEPPDQLGRFWSLIPLTFNHIETEQGSDASIFPPSDVDLVRSSQMEYNRVGNALREHRQANTPHYIAPKGALDDTDKDALENGVPNQVIELKAVAPNQDSATVIQPMKKVPLDPMLYDRKPLTEDALVTTGTQEANLGPAQPDVTATVGTIAEQSRMNVAASNVDDLDDFLSALAEASGEIILLCFDKETVQLVAGDGAAWPMMDRSLYVNELFLQCKAASSGRPNKAIDVANWERIAPLLMQSGANPQAIIRESVRRMDDSLEAYDFFPLPGVGGPQVPGVGGPAGGSASAGPNQPNQNLPSGNSPVLVGHK